MKFATTEIPDVVIIEPVVHADDRGFFMETWRSDLFSRAGIGTGFVQDNHSKSSYGILRGLHYQINNPQGKLVRVVAGEVFDVAVDLRKKSPTFGKWVGEHLSSDNKKILWIPPGFAHGFYVLSSSAEFVYKCTEYYSPENERSIIWNDEDINIQWPITPGEQPILSDKDASASNFSEAEYYL